SSRRSRRPRRAKKTSTRAKCRRYDLSGAADRYNRRQSDHWCRPASRERAGWARATIAPPMSTAVYADALYDPATAATTPPAAVLIDESRVVAAGRRDQVHVPADAVRVDAGGLTVLPGLIDCHVHLCIAGDGVVLAEMLAAPPSLTLLSAVVACRNT